MVCFLHQILSLSLWLITEKPHTGIGYYDENGNFVVHPNYGVEFSIRPNITIRDCYEKASNNLIFSQKVKIF